MQKFCDLSRDGTAQLPSLKRVKGLSSVDMIANLKANTFILGLDSAQQLVRALALIAMCWFTKFKHILRHIYDQRKYR
jgi:hypothetical protein